LSVYFTALQSSLAPCPFIKLLGLVVTPLFQTFNELFLILNLSPALISLQLSKWLKIRWRYAGTVWDCRTNVQMANLLNG
ncbi:hypothetical protein AVEN_167880-1, partial [Araneus ventricosus]